MVVPGIVVVVDGAVVVATVVVGAVVDVSVVEGSVVVVTVVVASSVVSSTVVSVMVVSPRDFRSSCICSSFRRTGVEGDRFFITSVERPLVRFTY